VEFDKATIVNFLKQQGRHEDAEQAQQQLPDKVDHEQHGNLLDRFGVEPQELMSKAKGLFNR
jgi:hypothetical protein